MVSLAQSLLQAAERKPVHQRDGRVELPSGRKPRRSKESGIPHGLYRRTDNRWHARHQRTDCCVHLGHFKTAREACERMARYLHCKPEDLPGMSREFWDSVKDEPLQGACCTGVLKGKVPAREQILDVLTYMDGELVWRRDVGTRARTGDPAGSRGTSPRVRINGHYYRVRRVVWLLHTGEWPQFKIERQHTERGDCIENLIHYVPGDFQYGIDMPKFEDKK